MISECVRGIECDSDWNLFMFKRNNRTEAFVATATAKNDLDTLKGCLKLAMEEELAGGVSFYSAFDEEMYQSGFEYEFLTVEAELNSYVHRV